MGKHKKSSSKNEITPYVPQIINTVTFDEIKFRHSIKDRSNPQAINKGDNYFHHVQSGFNFTYNGFIDNNICLVDPRTGKNVKVTSKVFANQFKLAGPATSSSLFKK